VRSAIGKDEMQKQYAMYWKIQKLRKNEDFTRKMMNTILKKFLKSMCFKFLPSATKM